MEKLKLLLFICLFSTITNKLYSQAHTFNGSGDGTSWSDASNWDQGSAPGATTDSIIIPSGFSVTHNADINYTGSSIIINGSVDFGTKKIKMKGASSDLTISSTGSYTGKKLEFESSATGTIEGSASVTVEEFKTKGTSAVVIDAACITVTNKFENKDDAAITTTASGCITFSGTDYTNSSSGGIFGCTSTTQSVCFPTGGSGSSACEFNGNGDGTTWSDASNWSCGSAPGATTDSIIIPSGFSVTHNADINYTGSSIIINGSVDFGTKKIKMKGASSDLTISSTGSFTGKKLEFESSATGTIEGSASVTVEEFKTKGTSAVVIDAACITVTTKLENKDAAAITTTASGCITFNGTDYTNTSTGGIFGCTSNTQSVCFPSSSPVVTNTFTGNGGSTFWSVAANWDQLSVPDPSSENVTIPESFSVIYNPGGNLEFENSTVFTICGTITMGSAHLHMKDDSHIEICPTGIFTGHEIKLEDDATGLISSGAGVNVEQIETKNNGIFTIEESCITVTEELKNVDSGTITGGGCIDYTGASNKYTNTGSGGIFDCTEPAYGDCELGIVALPVELAMYDVQIVDNSIVVSWETLSEVNNSHFEIWLGSDAEDYKLTKVVNGQGNSDEINKYLVTFKPDLAGILYIKLRQVDFNSDYEDTDIKSLFYAPSFSIENIVLYPNPSNRYIGLKNLMPGQDYQLTIYSNEGKLITSTKVDITNNTVNITSLRNGAYYVIVKDDFDKQFSIRFVKIE